MNMLKEEDLKNWPEGKVVLADNREGRFVKLNEQGHAEVIVNGFHSVYPLFSIREK